VLTGQARSSHVALADGDRIVVPPLGPTAAISGWVRRPGIYEIAGGRSSIDVRALLSLAGGLEVRGKYRLSVLRITSDGRNQMTPVEGQSGAVGDSEILFAQPAANQTTNMATLSGGTALAGQYSVKNTKLSDLLKSPGALGDNPYTLFGLISRRDPQTLLRRLISFTPVAVLKGAEDMDIQSDDIVRAVSAKEAQLLFSTVQRYDSLRQSSDEALHNPLAPNLLAPQTLGEICGTQNSRLPTTRNSNPQSGNMQSGNMQSSNTQVPGATSYPEAGRTGNGGSDSTQFQSLSQIASGDSAARQALHQAEEAQFCPGMSQSTQSNYQSQSQAQDQPQSPNPQQSLLDQTQAASQLQSSSAPQGTDQLQFPNSLPSQYPVRQQPLAPNFEEEPTIPGQTPSNREVARLSQLATQLQVDPLVLANFLQDHSVNIDGAVRGAGLYFIGPEVDLQSLLLAAGGLENWADKSMIEVISTSVNSDTGAAQTQRRTVSLLDAAGADYIVSPHDQVRVNKVFTDVGIGSVTLQGQVRHAGTYQILRGEHLSDLLMRAGGLTDSAYPYGTVFLRRSVAELEQVAFRREAAEIENQLLIAMNRRDSATKLMPEGFTAVQGYVDELRNQKALGRMTVVADPTVLAANPSADPLLESSDVIYVPQRPYTVAVMGEVLQPGSIGFRQGMSAKDYIAQVGGFSRFADESETFLVLPDGSARRVESSWFDFGGDDVPPGSTIFVARDISGIDLHQIVIESVTIFSQLATSAATLATLAIVAKQYNKP